MSTPKLPDVKHQAVIRLLSEGRTYRDVSRQAGVSFGTVANIANSTIPTAKETANRQIDDYVEFHKEKFEFGLERMRKWIGDTVPAKYTRNTPKLHPKYTCSLVINDLHAPFLDEKAFGQAIREGKAAGATECIVPGDLADFHSVSRYPKTRKSFSLVEEFQGVRAALRTLSENFQRVRLMRGNHDERWFKWLVSQGIPPDVLEFLKLEWEHSLDPIAKLAADFPNVEMLPVPQRENAHYAHISQVGDVVFSHSEKFSIIAGKATADVNLYCQKKYIPMGILQPYKVLIQAHTHSAARFFGDFGVLCIENGCLAQTPDYDGNPKLMGREPILGYTLLTQTNGVTDINKTHFYRVS